MFDWRYNQEVRNWILLPDSFISSFIGCIDALRTCVCIIQKVNMKTHLFNARSIEGKARANSENYLVIFNTEKD